MKTKTIPPTAPTKFTENKHFKFTYPGRKDSPFVRFLLPEEKTSVIVIHMLSSRICTTLLTVAACTALSPAQALQAQTLKLVPMPRQVQTTSDVPLTNGVRITCASPCSADDQFAADDLTKSLKDRGINIVTTGGLHVELFRLANHPVTGFTDEMKPEGYVIASTPTAVVVTGATAEGVFYGAQTVKQLIAGDGPKAVLHGANIHDWPAMKYRGLDDDLSRGPFPTLDFQKKQIRIIAAYKVNIYSPYFENTQAYVSNPIAAPFQGSITPEQARELVAYAKPYHVTIIPEQEAFGHLHKMLQYDQYSELAETPHGAVLAPGQAGSIPLIKEMFSELAANYPGPFLHLGADETQDLGAGQTKADVQAARGLGAAYIDFMGRIVEALSRSTASSSSGATSPTTPPSSSRPCRSPSRTPPSPFPGPTTPSPRASIATSSPSPTPALRPGSPPASTTGAASTPTTSTVSITFSSSPATASASAATAS